MNGIIIQARMGSTRLPGKILKDFGGKSLLGRIIERTKRLSEKAVTVIATSTLPSDDIVEKFCNENGIDCFRGSEQNVLGRYYLCAKQYGFKHVVRMTADNPFPDMEELERLIGFHIDNTHDYSECHTTLPMGVGMEIFTFEALERSMEKATLPKHFEHVDEYILDNLEQFRHGTLQVDSSKNHPNVRLTVDTEYDYKKACYIIENVQCEIVSTQEAIRLCGQYEAMYREAQGNV